MTLLAVEAAAAAAGADIGLTLMSCFRWKEGGESWEGRRGKGSKSTRTELTGKAERQTPRFGSEREKSSQEVELEILQTGFEMVGALQKFPKKARKAFSSPFCSRRLALSSLSHPKAVNNDSWARQKKTDKQNTIFDLAILQTSLHLLSSTQSRSPPPCPPA